MAVRVEVHAHGVEADAQIGHATLYQCTIYDDEHPAYAGIASYSVVRNRAGRIMGMSCINLGVSLSPESPSMWATTKMVPSTLRDLPLTRWDQAARSKVASLADPGATGKWSEGFDLLLLTEDEQVRLVTSVLLKLKYPDADQDSTPAGKRRRAGLERSARTAAEYVMFKAQGRTDPAVAIAERHDVNHSTARSWIHRARTAGFIAAPLPVGSPDGLVNDVAEVAGLTKSPDNLLAASMALYLTDPVKGGTQGESGIAE